MRNFIRTGLPALAAPLIGAALLNAAEIKELSCDKSMYAPGDTVTVEITLDAVPSQGRIVINCLHLDDIVDSAELETLSSDLIWTWVPPAVDHRGYFLKIDLLENGIHSSTEAIAVDVSSDWSRYPRYGFLSDYSLTTTAERTAVIDRLTRLHINGLQFYDWHWKHHRPLAGTVASPAYTWQEIAGRTNYRTTVSGYVDLSHDRNMKAMAYNLIYGAWEDASGDGVQESWRLYTDASAANADMHDLPDSWISDIYLMDPSNSIWQNYIISRTRDALQAFNFDGWHVDQLGNRGTRYNSSGAIVDVENSFAPFLAKIKDDLDTRLVFNAVDQYAQASVARGDGRMEFLYTELWSRTQYGDLLSVLRTNDFYGSFSYPTVLAAYVNKGISGSPGYMNTAAVLLADAVIFAGGGAHLEMGEHYLCSEYFPNDNLKVSSALDDALTKYYDFSTAYEEILRYQYNAAPFVVISPDGIPLSKTAAQSKVWVFNTLQEDRQVFHFINFLDAATMDWRDPDGIQTEPGIRNDLQLLMKMDSTVNRVWAASPDTASGLPVAIEFTQQHDSLLVSLPYLKYWTMLVLEFTDRPTGMPTEPGTYPGPASFEMGSVYPNPFNSICTVPLEIYSAGTYALSLFNIRGQQVLNRSGNFSPGHSRFLLQTNHLQSGVYFIRISGPGQEEAQKILHIK